MRQTTDLLQAATITCADCGKMQVVPAVARGGSIECRRCDRPLVRRTSAGYLVSLACVIASLLLFPPAVFMPLLDSTIQNVLFEQSRLVSSVGVIYTEVWFPFAFGFLLLAFLLPACRAMFQLLVLGSIHWGWKIWQRGRLFRWSEELKVWSMTDVVVIAGTVAYFRAAVPADVTIRVGATCYMLVALLTVVADLTLDRRAVWDAILPDLRGFPERRHVASCDSCEMAVTHRRSGDPCPRCGSTLDRNIAPRFAPALAAVAAAIPLTIPAYGAAIMINDQLTGVLEHTIVGTVQLLADRGAWYFGVIILVAGIAIPIFELIGLSWLLARVRFPSRRGLIIRTRLFRILHRLVRWPMIIPFIAALAAPIVDFRGIDDIVSGPGATPLFMMILLLMLAVRMFEPRLMWKTAGEER